MPHINTKVTFRFPVLLARFTNVVTQRLTLNGLETRN